MRRIYFAVLAIIGLAIFAPLFAFADNGHGNSGNAPGHNKKAKIDPIFVCSGGQCSYTLTGLPPSTSSTSAADWVQASIEFQPNDPNNGVTGFGTGRGCNSGFSAEPVQADGTVVFSLTEKFLECISVSSVGEPVAGSVTAYGRPGDSTNFNDPAISGTLITTTIS